MSDTTEATGTVATATITDSASGKSVEVNVPKFETFADVVARCDSESAAVSLAGQQWRVAMAPGARRAIAAAVKANPDATDDEILSAAQSYVDGYTYGARAAGTGSGAAKVEKAVAERAAKVKASGVKFSEAQIQALRDSGLWID